MKCTHVKTCLCNWKASSTLKKIKFTSFLRSIVNSQVWIIFEAAGALATSPVLDRFHDSSMISSQYAYISWESVQKSKNYEKVG